MKTVTLSLILVATALPQDFASNSMNVSDGVVKAVWGPPRGVPRVTGAPYSAERLGEYTPPSGGSSWTCVIARFARDAQGRIRVERAYKPAPFWLTAIFDPVDGVAYLLGDENKIAHRMPLPPPTAPPVSPLATTEDLGRQSIEGVLAQGTRTIFKGPGDPARGVLTVETWESAELKITLLTKSSNGHSGRLVNLSRRELDPALFRPPSDYRVVDEPEPFRMTIRYRDAAR